jgi:uncharacterized protein
VRISWRSGRRWCLACCSRQLSNRQCRGTWSRGCAAHRACDLLPLPAWLGNPTLNPAVLVFLLFTLGWQWAHLRLVLGAVLVFGGAWVATRRGPLDRSRASSGAAGDRADRFVGSSLVQSPGSAGRAARSRIHRDRRRARARALFSVSDGGSLLTLAPLSLPSAVMLGRAFPWRVLVVLAACTAALGLVAGGLAVLLRL